MATGAGLHPKSHTLRFPGTVVQLHSPQLYDDSYNGTDEDDFILSVGIAVDDDIAVDVDWHTNASFENQPIAKLTPQEHAAFTLLEQEAHISKIMFQAIADGYVKIYLDDISIHSKHSNCISSMCQLS
jgi:hypothetical protein